MASKKPQFVLSRSELLRFVLLNGIDDSSSPSSKKRGRVKKANGSKGTPGSKALSRPRKKQRQITAHDTKHQAKAPVATTQNGHVHLQPRS